MQDQIGKEVFPVTYRRGGQLIRELEDCIGFILEQGLYRKAGKNQTNGGHWPDLYDSGELGRKGISLNRKLYQSIMKKPDKPLIVYNRKQSEFYRLNDRDLISGFYIGKEVQKGRELIVTPFDAYTRVDPRQVPGKIRDLCQT